MQYVTPDVAKKIELSVERIRSGDTFGCPSGYGLKNHHDGSKGIDDDDNCTPCWRAACLEYIKENAPQDVQKGDTVIVVSSAGRIKEGHTNGSIGTVEDTRSNDYVYITAIFSESYCGVTLYSSLCDVRRISNLTAPAQPEPKPEPVKLYCVKPLISWLTKGKTYESIDGCIRVDTGNHNDDLPMRSDGYLVPLVSRPAKVGEFVRINQTGEVSKVIARTKDPSPSGAIYVRSKHQSTYSGDCACQPIEQPFDYLRLSQYLVLDGYDGRYDGKTEEKPEENPAPAAERTHVGERPKIVIVTDGIETIARLYENGKEVKIAQAKCSPYDKYDFSTGARIAFDRLIGHDEKPAPDSRDQTIADLRTENARLEKENFELTQQVKLLEADEAKIERETVEKLVECKRMREINQSLEDKLCAARKALE